MGGDCLLMMVYGDVGFIGFEGKLFADEPRGHAVGIGIEPYGKIFMDQNL